MNLLKSSAREKIQEFLDPGSFEEIGKDWTHHSTLFGMEKRREPGDGVVAGMGKWRTRPISIYAQDFSFMGGSLGEVHAKKICAVMDEALKGGWPIVGLIASAGARIHEGVSALNGYGGIFMRNVLASGLVPQISVVLGPCAGGAVYSPALTDFIIMAKGAQMFITGPKVLEAVTRRRVDPEELGGAGVHAQVSGTAHFSARDIDEALRLTAELLSYLPQNSHAKGVFSKVEEEPLREEPYLEELSHLPPQKAYDVRKVLHRVFDDGIFFEVHEAYGANLCVGFARLLGEAIGVVANQPKVLAGTLNVDASRKGARFVRFCDAFRIPIVTFVDVPGYLPGVELEHAGIIREGAKLLFAYAEASTPRVTLILRKAYGGAYVVLGSRSLQAQVCYAWPSAEISVMGPEAAIGLLFEKEIAASVSPDLERERLTQRYRQTLTDPKLALSRGYIDEIIQPSKTRAHLISGLRKAKALCQAAAPSSAQKIHSNMPL